MSTNYVKPPPLTHCVNANLGYSDTEYQMTNWIANYHNSNTTSANQLHILRSTNNSRRCFQILWKLRVPSRFSLKTLTNDIDIEMNARPKKSQCPTVEFNVRSSLLPNASYLQLIVPKNLFNKAQTQDKRYTFIFLTLIHQIGSLKPTFHANGLVFDSKYNTCERLEPYGCVPTATTITTTKKTSASQSNHQRRLFIASNCILDIVLADLFRQNVYISPCMSTTLVGPQRLQEYESGFQQLRTLHAKDFQNFGFCTTWVIWMLHLRLLVDYPDLKVAIQKQLSSIAQNDGLTDYILEYTKQIIQCK